MDPTTNFDWMVARAKDLMANGVAREAALDLAMKEGEKKAKERRAAEVKKPGVSRRPLTVTLGEAAKVSLLRQRRV